MQYYEKTPNVLLFNAPIYLIWLWCNGLTNPWNLLTCFNVLSFYDIFITLLGLWSFTDDGNVIKYWFNYTTANHI